jgi:hypothetical protein
MRYLESSVGRFDFRWAAKQARDAVIPCRSVLNLAHMRGGVGFDLQVLEFW